MGKFKLFIMIVTLMSYSLMANVTALDGGVDRVNVLEFKSDNTFLKLKIEDESATLLSTSKNLLIGNRFNLDNSKKRTGEKLLKIYLKQTKKSFEKTINYKFSKSLEKLTDEEIKNRLSKDLSKRLKSKSKYLSHQILNIEIPDDREESIEIEYKIAYKSTNKKLDIYTYKQLLSAFLEGAEPEISLKDHFLLKYKKQYFIAEVIQSADKKLNPLTLKEVSIRKYAVKIIEELNVYRKKSVNLFSELKDDSIFEITMYNSLPLTLSVINKEADLVEFDLYSIYNDSVGQYIAQEQKREIILNNFDFSTEPIWADFKVKNSNGIMYLKTAYKMVGKRKNIIQTTLNGSSSILKPQSHTTSIMKHDAYIADIKTFLFELKKTLKVNNKTKLKWTQKVKQSMLGVMYKDSDGVMVKKKISRGRKQFYDVAGMWYLISWSAKNNIDEKAFLLMKEDFPFEAKFIKTDFGYLVSVRGEEQFKFYLDKFHRIIKVEDVVNDVTMVLSRNGYMTQTIKDNIKFLDQYLREHNLKKVN